MSLIQAAAILGALVSSVTAHGHVSGIVADGTYYQGYDPAFQFQQTPPMVAGWSCPQGLDNGFVEPSAYTDPNIICHKGATPGGTAAKVAAGGTVSLQWTPWPESHHGPVLDYLANCNGDCSSVDKESLSFFKINQGGVIDGSTAPGTWASDELIANNHTWDLTIPSTIAPGNYVLRHEIIALHSAGMENGAQNYPQCINLEITGSGSDNPAGVKGTELYTSTDPGIVFNLYSAPINYPIPGPELISVGGAPSSTVASVSEAKITPTSVPTSISPEESAAVSQTGTIPSVIPSAILTSSLPPIPTPTSDSDEPIPGKPLPEGTTVQDLLDWLSYILHKFSHGGSANHPRALVELNR